MRLLSLILVVFLSSSIARAQLLSWSPAFAKENDAAQNLTIVMDASLGNQGLLNHTPTSDVYVHIGVITNLSTGPSDWKYVKFTWGTTNSQAQCSYLGSNKWQYTINGSLRTFFNITNGAEHILKIAILFRNGSGNKAQRNADGSDMYVPIYTNELAVRFDEPPFQPKYDPIPEPINKETGDQIDITALASLSSEMNLYLNGNLIQNASGVTSISATPTLTVSGTQQVIAEAIAGAVTKRDTFEFFVAPGVNIAPLPAGVRDGINYHDGDNSITFVLYAPGKNRVSLIGEFPGSNWTEQPQYLLNKTPDGNYWWLKVEGLTPGTEYAFQYLVDGTLKVGDPYAEKVLDPQHDGSIPSAHYPGLRTYPAGQTGIVSIVQTAAPEYNWAIADFDRPDKRRLIIYEMLLRDFLETETWETLTDTLSYFKTLGINAIELMPFNEFDGNISWGYNPSYFLAPDKYYGPANTLKRFIDSCHANGIAVIMDIALNHTTGNNPLAALYWNSATNQPAANNPWLNQSAPHPFSVFDDFNHESAATKYFFSRVVEHWLTEYKIDGFRFDLSKGFTQNNTGGDVGAWSAYDASRVAIWKGYYDTLQQKEPGSYVILEHFAANNEEIELSDYGMLLWGNHNHNFAQASMGWADPDPGGNTWNFEGGIFTERNWNHPHLITYMESHDEERLMYKNITFGNSTAGYNTKDTSTALKRVELNAAFFLSIPGPKMFWQFGELGYDYSITSCHPGNTIPQPYPSDQCRTDPKPVRWDYQTETRRKRVYDIYSSMMKLRNHPSYDMAFITDQVSYDLANAAKWLIIDTDTSNLVIIGNFGITPQQITVTFPDAGTWYDYLEGGTVTASGAPQMFNLQPGEYHVYLNRNIVNAVTTPVGGLPPSSETLQMKLFPNPGNGAGILELELPETGPVEISLMNLQGQKLQVLHSGMMQKGMHRLQVNASLPAGTYFIELRSEQRRNFTRFIIQ